MLLYVVPYTMSCSYMHNKHFYLFNSFCGFTHSVTIDREVERLHWHTGPSPTATSPSHATSASSQRSPLLPTASPKQQLQHQVEISAQCGDEDGTPDQPELGTYSDLRVLMGRESQSLFRFTLSKWKETNNGQE